MIRDPVLMVLGVLLAAMLLAALAVWLLCVRPYVKRVGARMSSPYTLAALVADFSTSLIYSRGRLPPMIRFFGFLLIAMAADLVLMLLLLIFLD